MTRTSRKRVEHLERTATTDLEIGIRTFAKRIGSSPEPILAAAEQYQEQLSKEI